MFIYLYFFIHNVIIGLFNPMFAGSIIAWLMILIAPIILGLIFSDSEAIEKEKRKRKREDEGE